MFTIALLKKRAVELGIPEYFQGLNDSEILELGLYFYEKHIETNLEGIKRDMGIVEVPETRDDWDEDDSLLNEWCDFCEMSVEADDHNNCPHCGNHTE